jgi:predicted O-methyltransferase YrrM
MTSKKLEYVNTISRYPSAWTGHGLFAMQLVESFKPDVIVDLGVDFGFSTFCLAYPRQGKVYGIDWFQGDQHTGRRNTYELVKILHSDVETKYGVDNIEFIKADFTEAAKTWDKPIDILHIDGLHTYEAVKADFANWSKLCKTDAIILFHDVESFPNTVGRFFYEISNDYHKLVHTGSAGLGVITKSKEKYDFIVSTLL